jgi:hypothetical protein
MAVFPQSMLYEENVVHSRKNGEKECRSQKEFTDDRDRRVRVHREQQDKKHG